MCLGGFQNKRAVFEWEGQTLEVDETIYTPTDSHPQEDRFYEIECELVRSKSSVIPCVCWCAHSRQHTDACVVSSIDPQ